MALLAVNVSVAADRTDAQVEIIYSVDFICNALRSECIGCETKACRQRGNCLVYCASGGRVTDGQVVVIVHTQKVPVVCKTSELPRARQYQYRLVMW